MRPGPEHAAWHRPSRVGVVAIVALVVLVVATVLNLIVGLMNGSYWPILWAAVAAVVGVRLWRFSRSSRIRR